jgi:hypothetical protein
MRAERNGREQDSKRSSLKRGFAADAFVQGSSSQPTADPSRDRWKS